MAKKSVTREILMIRRSFAQLAAAFAKMGPVLEEAVKNGRNGSRRIASAPARRTMTITPKRRAALKLQGRYMGTLRGLKPRQAAAIKKIRAEKGYEAALRAAGRMAL